MASISAVTGSSVNEQESSNVLAFGGQEEEEEVLGELIRRREGGEAHSNQHFALLITHEIEAQQNSH